MRDNDLSQGRVSLNEFVDLKSTAVKTLTGLTRDLIGNSWEGNTKIPSIKHFL